MNPILALLALALSTAACGSGGQSGNGGSGGGVAQPTAACTKFLSCLAIQQPDVHNASLTTLGPGGNCWKTTPEAANQCDLGCAMGLDSCGVDAAIDTGGTVQLGGGFAVIVEVAPGGQWHVVTSCDTEITGNTCQFDIVVAAAAGVTLSGVQGEGLGASDTVGPTSSGAVALHAEPSLGTAGMKLTAGAGAYLMIDVREHDSPVPAAVTWMSGGALQQGSDNPITFTPSGP